MDSFSIMVLTSTFVIGVITAILAYKLLKNLKDNE